MRQFLILSLFFFVSTFHSQIQTLLNVGDIPITSYDVEEMRSFTEVMGNKKPSASEALEALLYQTSLLIIAEGNSSYYMDETEFRRLLPMLTNASSQDGGAQRKTIYEKFPDLFKLAIRSDKVKRGLMYGEAKIKSEIVVPIPDKIKKDFYTKNKKNMKDAPFPKLDLIIFAVEISEKLTLSEITEIETSMSNLAQDLNKSSDFNTLKKKYSQLKFTKYSGETKLFTPDILVLQKGIPEEIIGISLEKKIPLGPIILEIVKNRGIFIPATIPLRGSKLPVYLTFKILNIIPPRELTYEEAAPRIEEILRNEKGEIAVQDFVRQRIKDGQITFTLANIGSFKPVIDRFISGTPASKASTK